MDPGRASSSEENAQAEQQFGPLYEKFAAPEVDALAKNPEALAVGQKLFLNTCAQCHASDGARRARLSQPDRQRLALRRRRRRPSRRRITDGRNGIMPPFGAALGEQGAKDVAHYVCSLSGMAARHASASRARQAAVRADLRRLPRRRGQGQPALGAPNLTDKIWLLRLGARRRSSRPSRKGRTNQMPAHKELLDARRKIHLLTAYVYSLSQQK